MFANFCNDTFPDVKLFAYSHIVTLYLCIYRLKK